MQSLPVICDDGEVLFEYDALDSLDEYLDAVQKDQETGDPVPMTTVLRGLVHLVLFQNDITLETPLQDLFKNDDTDDNSGLLDLLIDQINYACTMYDCNLFISKKCFIEAYTQLMERVHISALPVYFSDGRVDLRRYKLDTLEEYLTSIQEDQYNQVLFPISEMVRGLIHSVFFDNRITRDTSLSELRRRYGAEDSDDGLNPLIEQINDVLMIYGYRIVITKNFFVEAYDQLMEKLELSTFSDFFGQFTGVVVD